MTPLVFVDNRPRLPREAVATINLGALLNDTWLIKPRDELCDAKLGADVKIVDPRDLGIADLLRTFRARYVHLSTNSVNYERGCFERFIMLHGLMQLSGFSHAWHFDTDAWAAADLDAVCRDLDAGDMVLCIPGSLEEDYPSVSVSQSYLRRGVLTDFVHFLVEDFYSNNHLQRFRRWYGHRAAQGLRGGVSDMMAWGDFLRRQHSMVTLNSFCQLVSGHILVDTLYPAVTQQLNALGLPGLSEEVRVSFDGQVTVLTVGDAVVPVAGIHFSGADKFLMWLVARNRRGLMIDSLLHKGSRAAFRFRRRLSSISSRAADA